ncbi:MAG: MBL fold metallo-hydrolase [Clostridiales bacterium]|nr:MBL fold metallo-hydrolase [Clostridiales bacterium]
MKIHFFGSCSGTEPWPERHHCSFAIETEQGFYWFDAGENCSYTAYLMGVDLLRTRKVFISHSHMDHIGGLGNLFWNIRKCCWVKSKEACDVDLYLPEPAVWSHLEEILKHTEENFEKSWEIFPHKITDGILCDDEIKVSALHSHHLEKNDDGWRAFGFLIEVEGKRIVYTGDTRGYADYEELLPCDLLITETGHHRAADVARAVQEGGKTVGTLLFTHHGLAMLADPQGELAAAQAAFANPIMVVNDGQTIEL